MLQNREPRNKPTHVLKSVTRVYNGEESPINGIGKIEQLHARDETGPLSYTICKKP